MPDGLLLHAPSDFITCAAAELDDVERVEDGDGVLELVIEGVLIAVERIQGRHRDAGAERLVAFGQPGRVGRTGPAGHQVQQPCTGLSVAVTGQVDHPGQLLRPPAPVLERPGRHVMPHMLIHAENADTVEP
jgi:hypothetical protein